MEKRLWLGFPSIAAVIVLAGSCGSNTQNGFAPTPDGGGHVDGSGGSSGSSSGGLLGGDGSSGGCPDRCSSDLHSVEDCNGKVITTCPADQGCSGTGCVPACQSAQANKSTFGCEYYSVDPDSIVDARGDCFALFIANTWTTPVHITADWAGQNIDIASSAYLPSGTGASLTYTALGSNALQPNQVAIVFLNDWKSGHGIVPPGLNYDCPAGVDVAFTTQDGAVHGPAMGEAFHFTTDVPVVAYDILPYGGGQSALTSATLLLPTSAWDVNYVGVNAYLKDVLASEGQGFLQIVASQSNTTVTVKPTAAIVAGNGVAATAAGAVGTYTLANAGDYVQFTQDAELTGTAILADKPVGVWGGASCMNIDVNTAACDTGHQQLFPVKTLGHEYVATRYRDRFPGTVESTPYRIVGAVDGTNLTYDPSTPSGAPTSIDQGDVVTFWTQDPFVVSSQDDQHPFYLSAHMSGADTVNPSESDARGDPEFVNVIPPQEYLTSYVFFTDPTYPETNLVLVRAKGTSGFQNVTLDCAGTVGGWTAVGTSGQYEMARVDLSTGNFQGVGSCNNGRHEATSSAPFGLTVWGWGSAATGTLAGTGIYSQYVSYAYPAGASALPINTVVVQPTQ